MFEIDKSIPIPPPSGRNNRKYPFDKMETGDSFFVPLANGKSPSAVFASVKAAKRRLKINLTTARVDGGIRVWRIAGEPA